MTDDLARKAYDMALEGRAWQQGHDKRCDERYAHLEDELGEIKTEIRTGNKTIHDRIDKYASIAEGRSVERRGAMQKVYWWIIAVLVAALGFMIEDKFF